MVKLLLFCLTSFFSFSPVCSHFSESIDSLAEETDGQEGRGPPWEDLTGSCLVTVGWSRGSEGRERGKGVEGEHIVYEIVGRDLLQVDWQVISVTKPVRK